MPAPMRILIGCETSGVMRRAFAAPGTDEHKAWSAIHRASPGPDRWRFRSRTFEGVAAACAAQWAGFAAGQERALA